jgi:ferrochelatase
LLPLYPQHADSTRTTTVERVQQLMLRGGASARLVVFPPFFDRPDYIAALAGRIRSEIPPDIDQLILSYHGLPERQLTRADPTGAHCLKSEDCCERPSVAHATCYRHQTRVTSHRLASALGLDDARYTIAYQSRLGRTPWITPFTDRVLAEAPSRGWRRIAVACPSFVADNLETLEEIGIRGRELFASAGGERFTLLSCLNDSPSWVATVARWCAEPPR